MRPTATALHTDFYQITMAASYHDNSCNGQATFSLFPHEVPSCRGYLVAAGLEYCLDYLRDFHYTTEEIDYLRSLKRFKPEFLDLLSRIRFTGDVWAMPEGSVFFAGEPILEVAAPLIEAQLVETYLINMLNLHSTLASKAARCYQAAQGRSCVDFSLRRTMGLDAGFAAARSSAITGFNGTSNVAAAMALGLTPVGTMAHAYVEAMGDEENAFRSYAKTFPDNTVLLVDTYDSEEGIHKAVNIAAELAEQGHSMIGVRLDSGDLVTMSRKARAILDDAGLHQAQVVVSGSLDELRISDLAKADAAIDMLGIGTKMGSSADQPYIDLAYKLVLYEGRPTLKLSTGKETWASAKQVWRCYDNNGVIASDELCLREESRSGKALLKRVMKNGEPCAEAEGWQAARERFMAELNTLPPQCLALREASPVRMNVSPALQDVQARARAAALGKGHI